MRTVTTMFLFAAASALLLSGCSTAPKTAGEKMSMETDVQAAITHAKTADPGLDKFFNGAAGYAVFPTVGKGAIGIGGAYGKGELLESGQRVGYCTLTQASIGLALGGQAYTEIIFFETSAALEKFKSGNFAFAAQASAVALKAGASANAKYANGVAVFTMGEAGLMYEASIGGQKFSYQPAM